MTWGEALEIEVARGGVERYRWLCSDENPDEATREGYRVLMIRLATEQPILSTSLAQEFTAPAQPGAIAFVPQGCGGCGQQAQINKDQ